MGPTTRVESVLVLLRKLRYRHPRELRGDWWRHFERDFRLYAARVSAAGEAGRPPRDRRPPPR